jgi:hypothetical protein
MPRRGLFVILTGVAASGITLYLGMRHADALAPRVQALIQP